MIRQFMRPVEIGKELGYCTAHVRNLINEMKSYPTRYGAECYFGEGKGRTVRFAAVKDYADHKSAMKRTPEQVPALNLLKIERELGIIQAPDDIDIDRITGEVARHIITALGGAK